MYLGIRSVCLSSNNLFLYRSTPAVDCFVIPYYITDKLDRCIMPQFQWLELNHDMTVAREVALCREASVGRQHDKQECQCLHRHYWTSYHCCRRNTQLEQVP